MKKEEGFTLIELLVTIALVSLIASFGIPQISQFSSNFNIKSAATDFLQNVKLARAMAIKENREYLIIFDTINNSYYIGFDGNNDGDLRDLKDDTFSYCNDSNKDGRPDNDTLDKRGMPQCVKRIYLSDEYGEKVRLDGPLISQQIPPNEPDSQDPINKSIALNGGSMKIPIRTDGSIPRNGKVYFQHAERGYTYCITFSNYAGKIDLFKWKGDVYNNDEKEWVEVR